MIGIYSITNKTNGKRYIGQSVDVKDRLAHHLSEQSHNRHHNSYLQRAWNKYGESNFLFDVVQTCEENELDELERYYISLYDTTNREFGYNRESGGSLHKHMSDESKHKMSMSKKGKYTGDKNPMYGVHVKWTDERREKMSKRFSGENNPMYGVHLKISDERRAKMSEKMCGENNPFYGKNHTDETKQKMRKSNKRKMPVKCVETNTVYDSSCEAQRLTGIHCDSINKCCNRKQHTAGSYHWEFVTQ